MRCLKCHADNRDGIRFCEECGATLEQACPACGTMLPPGRKFCGGCGQPLPPPPEAGQAETPDRVREETAVQAAYGPTRRPAADAERRQLTVMFCDLVGSMVLSAALDPEDLREVLHAHHELCAKLIGRFDGHIAQYLGDGILAYFGYPMAHEDDGARAVRAALRIVQEMAMLNIRLRKERDVSLAVRLGIHTGLVVIGEIGEAGKHENLALGDTPNIAARAQAIAEPDTVVITAATHRLVRGLFDCQDLGSHALKGVAAPLRLYRVLGDRDAAGGLEAAETVNVWPQVGREKELALLLERWEQVKDGAGQVVLLNGEAGIGKSRLAQAVREKVLSDGCPKIEYRCSAYYQNSALYPIISHLQRLFRCDESDSPETKLAKIEDGLRPYRLSLPEAIPLLASLLGVPLSDRYPSLNLTPQRQKQKTVEVLSAWILEEAERHPVLFVVEDLHWADPSTVDFLGILAEQAPTARIFVVLTSRPDFTPSWPVRSHLTHIFLSRLSDRHVEVIVNHVTGGKALPAEVLRQVMAKTDGVPLFVEELTKMVLESGLLVEGDSGYRLSGPLPLLAIPATLHDSLMARLDRLSSVREVAQLAAVLGREFSYQLLEAVVLLDGAALDRALALLVEAEFLLQRGVPPHSRYTFKHALIQDVAYQSSLKSKRQLLHRRIAQVLDERLPETAQEQPEFLAHHYTEGGLPAPAIVYWVQAGQRAVERSANAEAICHLGHALDLLSTQPETPERARQELAVQMLLAQALMASRGMAAPEVEQAYARARELCEVVGHSDQLPLALGGLGTFYLVRGNVHTALEIGEQCLDVAQRLGDPGLLLKAHAGQGTALVFLGEPESGRAQINANSTPTFGIFVAGTGTVPFDPANNRVFVRFKDAGGVTRGSTGVAVGTQP
jgi:class 3 adenylate cyclase